MTQRIRRRTPPQLTVGQELAELVAAGDPGHGDSLTDFFRWSAWSDEVGARRAANDGRHDAANRLHASALHHLAMTR